MNKSNMLLSFLQKNCRVIEAVPATPAEQFDFYKRWINKLPKECINDSFLKIEDVFLVDALNLKDIVCAEKLTDNLTLQVGEAAFYKADAVLCFLNGGNDKSVYLYGGTRLKGNVATLIKDNQIVVNKANNVHYSGIISAVLPDIDAKLTSVILEKITDKYTFALNVARDNKLKSMVLCLPVIDNPLLSNRVADGIISAVKQHPYSKEVKILLLAANEGVYNIYKTKVGAVL